MRSLFMKVFLWFSVAMVLVGATLIFTIFKTQTVFVEAREDERDRALAPSFAANLADIYERQGLSALSAYLRYLLVRMLRCFSLLKIVNSQDALWIPW